jgi:hypothetical protein
MNKRLIVISGPSGVGKGPIVEWTKKTYPDIYQFYVRKTKTERHKGTEIDLGFVGDGEYFDFDCRGVKQRIYADELDKALTEHGTVLLETYYKAFDFLKSKYDGGSVDFASTFISPISKEEIRELSEQGKTLEEYLPDLMIDSLMRRAERDGKVITRSLAREMEARANDSISELHFAHNCRNVVPNHCYESDSRWKLPVLIGEPKKVVHTIDDIIKTGHSSLADKGIEYAFVANM